MRKMVYLYIPSQCDRNHKEEEYPVSSDIMC